jgi:hypothetical protein
MKLFEALESNSSLTNLNVACNALVALFHSHSMQTMILVPKQLSNYLKHSAQIHLSLHSTLQVKHSIFIPFSLTTGNNIQTEGAIDLFEALKSNISLVSFDLSRN